MSWDITVSINDIKNISKIECEKYLQQFEIYAELHPETNFETDEGFLPFKVEFPGINFLKGKVFISGFEVDSNPYDYHEDLDETKIFSHREKTSEKMNIFLNLFRKKVNMPSEMTEMHVINEEADKLLKNCGYQIHLKVNKSIDSFRPIMALAFASYLAEKCNGVICDTYSGEYYYNNVKQVISEQIQELFKALAPNKLLSHPFESWH